MPEPEWSLKTLMGHIPLGENTLEMFEVGAGGFRLILSPTGLRRAGTWLCMRPGMDFVGDG